MHTQAYDPIYATRARTYLSTHTFTCIFIFSIPSSNYTQIATRYWNEKFRTALLQRFPGALSNEESTLPDVRVLVDVGGVFRRLARLNGLQFTDELHARFLADPSLLLESECALTNKVSVMK